MTRPQISPAAGFAGDGMAQPAAMSDLTKETVRMKHTTPQQKVVIHAPHTALGWLIFAKAVYNGLSTNPGLFPNPNPPLTQLKADIDSFDAAEAVAQTRTKGTAAARDSKLEIVRADLEEVRAYVQGLVTADPANAANIAQAAGFALRKSKTASKSELSAKPSKTTLGSVDLVAKLGKVKACHDWQYSTDGGKTWIDVQTTLQAKTTVPGLQPGNTVVFRHRAVTKSGPAAWSQPISLIVT